MMIGKRHFSTTNRSNVWLLKQPTKNRDLLNENSQCRPETTAKYHFIISPKHKTYSIEQGCFFFTKPEEYDESIRLHNHAQNRPPQDKNKESNTK